jgi:hypothetical protein
MLISLAMLMAASLGPTSEQASVPKPADAKAAALDPYAGRPSARIPSSRNVRNFEVRREDASDRVVYLETTRNVWFRGEMICRGGGDPRDAHSVEPVGHSMGIDDNTTLIFRELSSQTSVCNLVSLISLTPEEALDLKLVRPPKAKKG